MAKTYKLCDECNGTGISKDGSGSPVDPCVLCNGDKYRETGKTDDDKVDDIQDNDDDIKEKVDEIKDVVDDILDAVSE